MNDDTQTPGAGPQGTGQESNMGGGSSEWSTVPTPQPPNPPAEPPSPPVQSLEPLPPAPTPPASAGGYQQVFGSQPPQGPPPGYAGGPNPQYPPPPPPPAAGQGLTSNAAAAISYLTFIPAVIFLIVEPYNRDRFVRFHAWQSIALWIVLIGLRIIFFVLSAMSFHLLWWMFLLVRMAIGLALFVFWLVAVIKASQGQWFKIPVVGDLAASFSGGQQ